MTKKQKKVLYRIVVSGILYAVLLVLFHTGLVKPEELFENERYGRVLELCLYVIVYAVIGGDIVKKAVVNIGHGQVFEFSHVCRHIRGIWHRRVLGSGGGYAVLSGRRTVSELCGEPLQTVDYGTYGHLPGICECRSR